MHDRLADAAASAFYDADDASATGGDAHADATADASSAEGGADAQYDGRYDDPAKPGSTDPGGEAGQAPGAEAEGAVAGGGAGGEAGGPVSEDPAESGGDASPDSGPGDDPEGGPEAEPSAADAEGTEGDPAEDFPDAELPQEADTDSPLGAGLRPGLGAEDAESAEQVIDPSNGEADNEPVPGEQGPTGSADDSGMPKIPPLSPLIPKPEPTEERPAPLPTPKVKPDDGDSPRRERTPGRS